MQCFKIGQVKGFDKDAEPNASVELSKPSQARRNYRKGDWLSGEATE